MRINLTAAAAAIAIAFGAAGAARADVKIGYVGPMSGGSAPMGESMRAGIKVAVDELNAKGGINGEKIVMVDRDDQAKNENGPLIAQELINREKVVATLGFCNTGVALPALQFFQESKTPLIVPCAAGAPVSRKFAGPEHYVFRVAADDIVQATKVVQEAKRRGLTKVAVVVDTTAYGKFGHDELVKAAAAQGVEVVADESFAVGDKDMVAQLLKSKQKGAQALLTWGIGPELAILAKDRVKVGFKVPMIGGWTLSMSNFIEGAGKAGDGVVMPATFLQYSATPGKQANFVELATKALGKPVLSSGPAAAQGYDSMMLLAAAMTQAKSFEGPKVKLALEDLKTPVEGIVQTYKKPFSVDKHDAQTVETTGMGEIKDGKVRMVK
jgi:branched-chain amino acid transport system substrate-binding protein